MNKLTLNKKELLATGSYINGEWYQNHGSPIPVFNPATQALITTVSTVGVEETRAAIDAATTAFPEWSQQPAKERAQLLRNWYNLIIQHSDDLARILTAEQGKTLAEAKGEIVYGANFIEWFAEEAKRVNGDIIPAPSQDKRVLVIKQPVGVVAAITPWNFPNAMITRKVAPALAAGCTFVGKPATETPLSALALCQLAEEAGIPPGVFNMIIAKSSREIGLEFSTNSKVRKLTFTGSTPIGKQLIKQSADTVKKVSMELGGNAPFIVFDDADVDAAIAGAIASKFRNSGQTCVCTNRFLVQRGIHDVFVEKLKQAVDAFTLGDGLDPQVSHGPLVNKKAVDDVSDLVNDALNQGAKAISGGQISSLGDCFYKPTILSNVTTNMRVFREEIFGPVAPIIPFDHEHEAITLANDTEFGLAAYFYTKDLNRIFRVGEALEYGILGINEGLISNEMAPFGGVKESGNGREGSKYGMDDYLEIKYMCLGGIK